MISDAQSAVRHLEAVLAMAQRLAALDIAIYEHSFLALDFGSYTIIAGNRKERVRFSWEGKDGFLTVEQAAFPDSRHIAEWEQVEAEGVDVRHSTETLDAAERYLTRKFAA